MPDETVVIRKAPPSFAYFFWASGPRRGEHATLRPEGMTLGRAGGAEIVLDDETVSSEHARVRQEEGAWYLYDLASANTSKVGGEVVHRRTLADGDRVTLGVTELVFRLLR